MEVTQRHHGMASCRDPELARLAGNSSSTMKSHERTTVEDSRRLPRAAWKEESSFSWQSRSPQLRRQRWGSNYPGLQNISQSLKQESGKKAKLKMFETQDAKLQDLRNMPKVHCNRSQLGTPAILCRHCKLTKPPNTSQAMFIHKGQQDYSLSWRNWYWTL